MSCDKYAEALWDTLPSVALTRIFELLTSKDRLNASAACSHWRGVLFQKKFFKDFKCKLYVENDLQCTFFRKTLWNLTNELTLIFNMLDIYHLEKLQRILLKVACSGCLEGVRFQSHSVGIFSLEMQNEYLQTIETFLIQPLRVLLGRKNMRCRILDFGAIEMLVYYSMDLLDSVSQINELRELALASINYDPLHYPIMSVNIPLLVKCNALQVLSLDYEVINEHLLSAMECLPLKKLLIAVHSINVQAPGISERTWLRFANNFRDIDLILTFMYTYEAVELMQQHILRRSMPLTHLRVLFCEYMNVSALEWISLYNSNTLKSVQWIDAALKHSSNTDMDQFIVAGQDPFVMMAWRCIKLQEIVIHGYALDPHNLVGIARLRGRSLKRLEVSTLVDRTYTEANVQAFLEEINGLLGRKWQPQNLNNLHPALGYLPVTVDVRDNFVFDLLRRDMSA